MRLFYSTLATVVILFTGCAEKNLVPLTLDQLPAALQESFSSSGAQLRKEIESLTASIQSNQLALAAVQLSGMISIPEITPKQRTILSQAQVAVNEELRSMMEAFESAAASSAAPGASGTAPTPPTEEATAAAAVLHHYQQTK